MSTTTVADLRATLLRRIDGFLALHGVTATEFGKRAVGDGNFVRDLKTARRSFTMTKLERVERYLNGDGDVG